MKKRKKLLFIEDNQDKIKLSDPVREESIESYVQLTKLLSSEETQSIDDILSVLNKSSFIEDTEIMYRGMPVEVYYRQLPVVAGDEIKVKIVLLVQADSMALIIPENVSDTYKDIKEDPSCINDKNKDLDLYAEVYRFDTADTKLFDIFKSTYLSSGNSLRAFDIPEDVEKEAKDDEEGNEEDFDMGGDFGGSDFGSDAGSDESFDTIDEPVEDFDDLEENVNSYKKFKNQTDALDKLVKKLYNKIDEKLREDVKTKYLDDKKAVLVVEVNNKDIYSKYSRVTKIAKKIMTNIGESIRRNNKTQLVDSFIKNGKRYFIVAEDVNNNFWLTKDDKLETLSEGNFIDPIQDEIITLKKSSVRKEARKLKPYTKDGKIIYRR